MADYLERHSVVAAYKDDFVIYVHIARSPQIGYGHSIGPIDVGGMPPPTDWRLADQDAQEYLKIREAISQRGGGGEQQRKLCFKDCIQEKQYNRITSCLWRSLSNMKCPHWVAVGWGERETAKAEFPGCLELVVV